MGGVYQRFSIWVGKKRKRHESGGFVPVVKGKSEQWNDKAASKGVEREKDVRRIAVNTSTVALVLSKAKRSCETIHKLSFFAA